MINEYRKVARNQYIMVKVVKFEMCKRLRIVDVNQYCSVGIDVFVLPFYVKYVSCAGEHKIYMLNWLEECYKQNKNEQNELDNLTLSRIFQIIPCKFKEYSYYSNYEKKTNKCD